MLAMGDKMRPVIVPVVGDPFEGLTTSRTTGIGTIHEAGTESEFRDTKHRMRLNEG